MALKEMFKQVTAGWKGNTFLDVVDYNNGIHYGNKFPESAKVVTMSVDIEGSDMLVYATVK